MGTHPIFESDFDCLTESHESRPCPSYDPYRPTRRWRSKIQGAKIRRRLGSPWRGYRSPCSIERRVLERSHYSILASWCHRGSLWSTRWSICRSDAILYLGRSLLLRPILVIGSQCLQAFRLTIQDR